VIVEITPIYPVPSCETAGAYTVIFRYSSETFPSEISPAESPTDEGKEEEKRRQTPKTIKMSWCFIGLTPD
jgi:hypothetical protein